MKKDNFLKKYLSGSKNSKDQVKDNIDVYDLATTLRNEGTGDINSDVSGSYTGMTSDNEAPVQDADDL